MAERVGHDRPEDRAVDHHDGSGDAGHAAAHQREQFAARHGLEIGPHQQRRLDHADEDVHGGADPERPADAGRLAQDPGEAGDDALQNAPVEQQRGERADRQDQRKGAKGENEARPRMGFGKRQRAAAEIAEDEGRPGIGGLLQRFDGRGEPEDEGDDRWRVEEQQSQGELQRHAGHDDADRHGPPVLAERKGQREKQNQAAEAMQNRHCVTPFRRRSADGRTFGKARRMQGEQRSSRPGRCGAHW